MNLFSLLVLAILGFDWTQAFQAIRTHPSSPPPATLPRVSQQEWRFHRERQSDSSLNRLSSTKLSAAPASFIGLASSPIGSLAILAAIVLIHESGHYLAAKNLKIKVEEFSVGIGPKLLGFRAMGNDFSLRALPLGGYVRFPENYNSTLARERDIEEFRASRTFFKEQATLRQRILNIVTLGSIEEKIWEKEKKLRQTEPEKPWWQPTIGSSSSSSKAVVDIDNAIEFYDDPDLLQNRPWHQRALVISAGVIFNLLLAFCIYFGQINVGQGVPVPKIDNGIVVRAMPKSTSAASGLLRQGDVILGVNGQEIVAAKNIFESQRTINDFIQTIRTTADGESLSLSIVHEGRPSQIKIEPKRMEANSPPSIGVMLSPNFVGTDVVKTSNPAEAADLAFQYVSTLTKETAKGFVSVISGLLSGSANNVGSQVTGPIGLIRAGAEVVATKDLSAVLLFAAAISVNLGVINSIPLPGLDGGQLVFVLAEAITGRKIDQRFEEAVTSVAILLLLWVTVVTFAGDLSSLLSAL